MHELKLKDSRGEEGLSPGGHWVSATNAWAVDGSCGAFGVAVPRSLGDTHCKQLGWLQGSGARRKLSPTAPWQRPLGPLLFVLNKPLQSIPLNFSSLQVSTLWAGVTTMGRFQHWVVAAPTCAVSASLKPSLGLGWQVKCPSYLPCCTFSIGLFGSQRNRRIWKSVVETGLKEAHLQIRENSSSLEKMLIVQMLYSALFIAHLCLLGIGLFSCHKHHSNNIIDNKYIHKVI